MKSLREKLKELGLYPDLYGEEEDGFLGKEPH